MDLERIWLVGDEFAHACPVPLAPCPCTIRCFKDVEAVKIALREEKIADTTILIKGSNSTKLHQLPDVIQSLEAIR